MLVKCRSKAEIKCKIIWDLLNQASKADKTSDSLLCVIAPLSWSQNIREPERKQTAPNFLFHWPSTYCSRHGSCVRVRICVQLHYVYVCGCGFVSSGHVSWDPWWWIRAGTNVLVHLWNENQGRGGQTEKVPITLSSGLLQTNLTLYDGLMVHTHTLRHTYILTLPHAFSLPFFFMLETFVQNRPDSHTIRRVACSARHVWPHCQKKEDMDEMSTHKKEKSSTGNTSGERFSKCNKEALQYNNSII